MELNNTYRQDTTGTTDTVFLVLPDSVNSADSVAGGFSIFDTLRSDSVALEMPDTTTKVQEAVLAQPMLRQRRREIQHEVNGKNLMESKKEVNLVSSTAEPDGGIALPVRERNSLGNDWLAIVLIVVLVLFSSVKFNYSKYLHHLFQSVVNYSTSYRMFEERSYSVFNGAVRLEIIFYTIVSLLLFQLAGYFDIEFRFYNWLLYFFMLAGVILYFLAKKMLYRIVGNILEGREETGEYLFNHDNFNRIAGLVLFPIVTLAAFIPFKIADNLILVGAGVWVVFYLLLLARGISILLKKQFSIFYLFLYLCSLEFLPLLLIFKIVVV